MMWHLFAKRLCDGSDPRPKIELFKSLIEQHGGGHFDSSGPPYFDSCQLYAEFIQLPAAARQIREQLEQAGFIDPHFARFVSAGPGEWNAPRRAHEHEESGLADERS
jgi:hypothetical protein